MFLESLHLLLHKGKVAANDAFGYFDCDERTIHAGGIYARADLLYDVEGLEVGARQVDGVRHDRKPRRRQDLDLMEYLVEHIQVQFVYEPGVFECGNKVARRKEPAIWVNPARQRLLVADPAVHRPDDGLIIHLNPVFADCLVEMIHDVAEEVRLLEHVSVEVTESGIVGTSASVASMLCTVACHTYVYVAHAVLIDAHANG